MVLVHQRVLLAPTARPGTDLSTEGEGLRVNLELFVGETWVQNAAAIKCPIKCPIKSSAAECPNSSLDACATVCLLHEGL